MPGSSVGVALGFDVLRTSGEPIEQLGAVVLAAAPPGAGRAQLTCAWTPG